MNPYCILTLSKFSDQFQRLINNLYETCPKLSKESIYVVDDGLTESVKIQWPVHYTPGKIPFIFARNFNLGIQQIPPGHDVFFIGDDAVLLTKNGIDKLAGIAYQHPRIGMTAPVISGSVGNYFQQFGVLQKPTLREELQLLPGYNPSLIFIAVYIKRELIDQVGPIPESLVGYGFEDNYFSMKLEKLGYTWAIDPSIIVYHGWGPYSAASSYLRSGQDPTELMEINRKIYKKIQEEAEGSL
ncbi:MAG: hypothetical protein CK425_03560 [Parachlamydia sp.]|nr:MAG: hypothetical protein CK425_03560 [Parachlamydia sp.]